MRPPGLGGTSVMFADQIPAATVQPHQQRRHFQQQQQLQNGHGGRRVQIVDSFYPAPPSYPGQHQPAHTNQGEPPPGQAAYQQQQQQMPPTGPGSPPPARQCQCCPFGFHIDLGFVKFAEDVAAGKEQIQNWSSPDKKRARRLMASPSSDRTQMDMSGSDLANISSSYPNDSSLMSKSLDIDELPELSAEHHQHHHSHGTPSSLACSNGNANHRPRAPSVPASSSQYGPSPQGILKNAGDWQQHQGHAWPTARTAPISNGSGRGGGQQNPGPALFHPQRHVPRHYMPQMQHQSRFYEAHVQQQQQQHRRRHPLSVPAEQPALVGSSSPAYLGSPLMASTPRGAVNDELQPMLAMQHHQQHHHHQHSRPLQISTGQLVSNGRPAMNGAGSSTTTTTTSAPSSPVPRAAARTSASASASANYQSSIAQSMAQLRRSPQKAMATMTFSSKPQAHTSLSALSTMARSAFMPNAPAITARRHYLESGGSRRVLSPEPHLPMGDGAVRSSNLQNRAFFHQNQSASAPGTAIRVPYRSRGAGSAPHIGPSFGTSTLELADFASVRRRRLNADIGGHAQLHSAHLVRSLSPPMHLPLGSAFSSSSPSSAGSLPRWPSGHVQQQQRENCAHSLATLPEPEVSELYDEGTLKADKSKRRKKQLAQNGGECQEPVPKKNFGTQTPPRAAGKEIGICTEGLMPKRGPPTPPPPMAPAKGRAEFSEIGTSPDPALAQQQQPIYVVVASSSPAEELPFAGLVQFASIAVDTRDLAQEEGEQKRRGPPAPPPKPSGPEVEAELRRRRQQELMGSLVAEFQYCLGHEPEHHPDHEPTLLPKARKFADAQLQVHLRPETIERGVDAHWATKSATIGTSTSDLAKPAPVKVDVSIGTSAAPKMAEIGTATETERPKQLWAIAVQTDIVDEPPDQVQALGRREGSHPLLLLLDAETQTDGGWLETEIGRRLAEAEAERKEKRKRHSVERGTETDEEEPPDQFIMITCNKCEQRSSVASDELFEKILGTEEPAGEELKLEECVELHAEQAPMLLLETVKEEPEFLTGREEEGVTIPDLSGGIARNELGESAKYTEPISELIRSLEFESMEMWRLVHIAVDDCTEEQKAQMLPKAEAVPTLLFVDGPVLRVEKEEKRPEITQAPAITVCTPEMAEKSATTLPSSQMDRLLQGGTGAVHGQAYKLKEQSTSPDEGLVLAEEEFDYAQEQEDMDLETEVDRVSIETDVQTVICVEPSMAAGRSSSSASGSKTPTTPTPNGEEASPSLLTPSLLSARTEALRKLLTEPPRQKPFQRDVDSNRSYRSDRSKALDLDYIADRHKSRGDQQQQQESEPSTPCSSTQTKKALRETISLKKAGGPSTSSAPLASHSNATFPPDPIPARIPRPKIARYSPRDVLAETPDEEEEAADRLTPLRSEMRSLSAWAGGSPSSSPRLSQRALIFRTQIGGPLEEEDEEEEDEDLLAEVEGAISSSSNREQLPQDTPDDASSTSSESARTYELSEEDTGDFELSAPLRDALETINDFLLMGSKTPTTNAENEQQSNQIEWAHKYAQHEWLKMATRKNVSAELVEQFIDSLESHSTQLMDTVINMIDQNGNTALHYAVSNENFDVVSVLLDSKVCRVDQMNKAGYSALMLGALCELRNETECAIMQRLFQMGNVNAKAVKHAQTALMLAASHGRVESTNLLLKCGADVNIQDVDGSTALMCAAEHGQKEIVKTLLKQPNIDASLTDCDSQTALSIAVENQHRDIGVLIYAHLNFSRLAETSGDNSVSI